MPTEAEAGPGLSWVTPDARWLLAGRAARGFGYGFLGVLLAVYLAAAGLDDASIGVVLGASLGGATIMAFLSGPLTVRFGRRRVLAANALAMAAAALVFALTDQLWLLVVAAVTGTVNVSGAERGAFVTIEQAALPQTAPDRRRTDLFAVYSSVGAFAAAGGALVAGLPGVLEARLGLAAVDAMRLMLLLYAALGLVSALTTLRVSPAIEVPPANRPRGRLGVAGSGGRIARLSALAFVDSFGSGFIVQSLVAYWFYSVHGLSFEGLGGVFSASLLLEAGSYWAAVWLARRIGLLNTMVFTHIPANLLMMALPWMPSPGLAVAVYLLRTSLAQMDVPTRQSYIMAVVRPEERVAAAGIERMARGLGQTVSPMLAGAALQAAASGLPFVLGGGIKAVYDIGMWFSFRAVRPPEEQPLGQAAP